MGRERPAALVISRTPLISVGGRGPPGRVTRSMSSGTNMSRRKQANPSRVNEEEEQRLADIHNGECHFYGHF